MTTRSKKKPVRRKSIARVMPETKSSSKPASGKASSTKPDDMLRDIAQLPIDDRVRLLRSANDSLRGQLSKAQAHNNIFLNVVHDLFGDRPVQVNVPKAPQRSSGKKRVEIPVLCMGDMHIGYFKAAGRFAYNHQIAKDRMHLTVEKFIHATNDRRNSAKIETLRLYLLGDMIDGENMRAGHPHEIEGHLLKQAMFWAPEALASCIIRLLAEFRTIKIVAVPGNHGRNGPPRSDAHPATNWDSVCYLTARHLVTNAILSNNPSRLGDIEWDLPTDREKEDGTGDAWYAIDYVFDWCNCVIHGENISGKGWGGIPFYAIEKMANRYAAVENNPIDYLYMGHIHVDAAVPTNFRKIFVNGAIESSTTYIRKELMSATQPSQSAVYYDEGHGDLARLEFHLGDRRPAGKRIAEALTQRAMLPAAVAAATA